jgi:hypothetical protein
MSLDPDMTVTANPANEYSAPRRRALAGVVALGQGWIFSGSGELTDEEFEAMRTKAERTAAPAASKSTTTAAAKRDAAAERDRQIAASMLGDWELFDEGRYQLTLLADKTGKLTYKPDGFKNKTALALWSGELKIDIRWSVKKGLVEMSSISGTPKFAFTVATESRGKRKLYRVTDLSDKRLVLFELKNKKTDNWRKLD